MKFVKRRATTSKSKFTPENFAQLKADFLDDLSSIVELEDIPPELVLSWDQTGIKLVPVSNHTMDRQDLKRIKVAGIKDKRLILAVTTKFHKLCAISQTDKMSSSQRNPCSYYTIGFSDLLQILLHHCIQTFSEQKGFSPFL